MVRKFFYLALCLLVLTLAGCNNHPDNPGATKEPEEILIGEFGSLTGTTATFGISSRNGIEMAIDEINKAGGVLGKKVRVIVEDDQGRPEEAQTVVTKLVNKDRVVAVLGEVASSRSLAGAPVCQANRIPMITPSSTNPKVTQVGNYIFRVCFIDPFQGFVMAKFASSSLKFTKVGILRDIKNDYSVGLADVFRENFQKMGGTIVADESYSEGDTDFSAQLTSIKSTGPQAIFVPGYYTEAGLIARQARKLGITVPLMGGDGWDSPKLWEIGGEALNDCYLSNHYSVDDPSPKIQQYVAEYQRRYNQTPDALSALAYDAAHILFDAFRRAGSTDPAKVRDALAQTSGFSGVTGSITIDKDRNAVKPAVVLRVKNGKLEYVESVAP